MECVELAPAVGCVARFESGSKLHALHTLRAVRFRIGHGCFLFHAISHFGQSRTPAVSRSAFSDGPATIGASLLLRSISKFASSFFARTTKSPTWSDFPRQKNTLVG